SPEPLTRFQAMYKYSWIVFLYASLMMVTLLSSQGLVARVARVRLFRELGKVSYCVYLIHLAALAACHKALLHSQPSIDHWPGVITTLFALALTLAAAQFSRHYFERPLLNIGHGYKYETEDIPIQAPRAA